VINAAPAGLAAKAAKFALTGAAAGGGLIPMLAKLSESAAFKVLLGGIIIVAAFWLTRRHSSTLETQDHQTNTISVAAAGAPNGPPASNQLARTTAPVKANTTEAAGRVLMINVAAADSGKPIPDVEFDYWLWIKGDVKHKKPLYATRLGTCKVPIPDHTTELSLVSERDGFADTLLDWHVDHGEQIPAQYTLRVARAVPIGGTVLGPDGNPVAGAEVGFNNNPDPGLQTRPQNDDFGWPFWITAKSDSQGRWEINRLGKETLKTIYGSASHPDFVGTMLVRPGQQADLLSQMLTETYVFKLGRAVVVQGAVKDPDGNAVPNAKVLVGKASMGGSRNGKSRADGTFSIAGCVPGTNVITAQAKGFAAATLDVNLTDNAEPFELILHPGKLLKLRVVDEDGNPVPRADVWLDTFQNGPVDSKEPAPPQIDFQRQTDAQGRLQWAEAPDGELKFTVSADGYMRGGDYQCRADGTEHVATLQHGLTISGTVSDAATGQPVPHFRIVAGNPNYDPITQTTNISWSTIDRYWLSFAGGSFQYTWDEPPVYGGDKDPEFVFKFEADGYAPYVSRVIKASERSVRFELRLTPAVSTEVTVLSPNNERAANADIGLASPGTRLSLVPGGLSRENVQSGGSLLMTDSAGHFALPPDQTIARIIATSPQGYGEATPAELAANPVIQLRPWGRLEGIYLINGKPAPASTLSLKYKHEDSEMISFDVFAFQTKTDHAGHFAFAQAPPGNFRVMVLYPFHDNMGHGGWSDGPSEPVTISPGATTTVTIEETNMASEFVNQ
jgi:protocatechuate 3,4-dioxygenase beta subunit